jgi:ATP-dependent Clp protease ATP-binding subunit ClpC
MVRSNETRSEYTEDDNDDFDEEKKSYSQQSKGKQAGAAKSKTPVLDNFGRDITRLAETGSLDPIVGREAENRTCITNSFKKKKEQSNSYW